MNKLLFTLVVGILLVSTIGFSIECSLTSVTPSDILENSTGLYELIVNCTDDDGINATTFLITRTINDTVSDENHWSLRPPNNDKSESNSHFTENILLADGRVLGDMWYDSAGIFSDNYTYAVAPNTTATGQNPYIDLTCGATWCSMNYTSPVEVALFPSTLYLSRGKMEIAEKYNHSVNIDDGLLVKFWDGKRIHDIVNYTTNVFFNVGYENALGSFDLEFYYCNSTYNIAGGVAPQDDDDNCVYLNGFSKTDIDNGLSYSSRNSSYIKGTYTVINGMIGGIHTTNNSYGYLRSRIPTSQSYYIKYANSSSGTNVSFADSDVAWTSTDDGDSYTQADFTPDIWFSQISANSISEVGIYVEDNLGNDYTNFTFIEDEIGDVNYRVGSPNIESYAQGIKEDGDHSDQDDNLLLTFWNWMTVHINMAIDPDGVGIVNHTLSLLDPDGSFVQFVNATFYSPDDSDVHVYFNTSEVADGEYKMQINATSDEDAGYTTTQTTSNNFTIENDCSAEFDVTQGGAFECANVYTQTKDWSTNGFELNVTGDIVVNSSSTFNMTNSDLNVGGNAFFTGIVWVDPSLVNITGDLNCSNTSTYYDSEIIVGGDLNVLAGCDMTLINSTLDVTGDALIEGTGNLDGGNLSVTLGSLTINSGGTYSATSGTTEITDNDGTYSVNFVGTGILNHNNGTFNITTPKSTYLGNQGLESYYNLIMDMGDVARNIRLGGGNCLVDNDFTASSGEMLLESSRDFIVDGDVVIEAGSKITGNAYPISFGSLTVNSGGTYDATSGNTTITSDDGTYTFTNGGTFTHNNGTIVIESPNDGKWIRVSSDFGNFILDNGGVTLVYRNELDDITGNLTLVSGNLEAYSGKNIDVDGDVIIGSGCTLDTNAVTPSTAEFGSLTINSGGTYDATSDVTTVFNYFNNFGNYTHNEGTFKSGSSSLYNNIISSIPVVFYNLNIDNDFAIGNDINIVNSITGDSRIFTYEKSVITLGNSTQKGIVAVSGEGFKNEANIGFGSGDISTWTLKSNSSNFIGELSSTSTESAIWDGKSHTWIFENMKFNGTFETDSGDVDFITIDINNVTFENLNVNTTDTLTISAGSFDITSGNVYFDGTINVYGQEAFDKTFNTIHNAVSDKNLNFTLAQVLNMSLYGSDYYFTSDANITDILYIDSGVTAYANAGVTVYYCTLDNNGATGGAGTFQPACGLEAPTAVSPIDELLSQLNDIFFDWNPVDDTINYIINIFDSGGDLIHTNSTITNDNYTYTNDTNLTEGIHSWEVFANNTVGISDSSGNSSFKLDVTDVNITFYTPTEFSTTTYNDNITQLVTVNDTNLYGTNSSIKASNGTSVFFGEVTGITANNYTWDNNTGSLVPDTYTHTVCGSDDHTAEEISISETSIDGGYEYTINGKKTKLYTKESDRDKIKSVTVKKTNDRASEIIEFKNAGTNKIIRYVESKDKITARLSSGYDGHVVIGDGLGHTWYDTETDDPDAIIKLNKVSDYKYEVTIETKKLKIETKSIGGINVDCDVATFIINDPITISTPMIYTTSYTNYSDQDVYCNATMTDSDSGQTFTMNTTFYENATFIYSSLEICASGANCIETLDSSFTALDMNYSCSVFANDGYVDSTTEDSTNLTILNKPPSIPSLIFPLSNADVSDSSSSIPFDWSNSIDIDNDTITYHFQLASDTDFLSIVFENSTLDVSNNTWTISGISTGNTYYWRVKAVTAEGNSTFASLFSFDYIETESVSTTETDLSGTSVMVLFIIVLTIICASFFITWLGLSLDQNSKELKILLIVFGIVLLSGAVYTSLMLTSVSSTLTTTTNMDGSVTTLVNMTSIEPIIDMGLNIFTLILAVALIVFVYFTLRYVIEMFEKLTKTKSEYQEVGGF